MIKDFKEYKTYRSRLLTEGITAEESAEIEKEMEDFARRNPDIFHKMSESEWVGSLTNPQ